MLAQNQYPVFSGRGFLSPFPRSVLLRHPSFCKRAVHGPGESKS